MARYTVGIVALSGTELSEQLQFVDVGAGDTFLSDRRDVDTTFAIQNHVIVRLVCLLQGINDGLFGNQIRRCRQRLRSSNDQLRRGVKQVLRRPASRPPPDQHLLPPPDVVEDNVNSLPIAPLAAAGLHSRREARFTGRAGEQGGLRCRWLDQSPPGPLHDKASTATPLGCGRSALICHKPKFWARYVDDTFVVIERDQLLTFKEHLNAVFPDIKFAMVEEVKNQQPFLDVLLCRKDCGGLKTKMFRKVTSTMQILNFNCNHPISHKRSCTKAFDTVNRDKLWKIMRKFCCPERFTQVVRQLHDDSCTVSKAFAVINGVKHGCVHAPTLFSLMSAALLMNAHRGEHPGIRIVYNLSSCQHMRVPACRSTTTVHDLFADECALSIATEEDIQRGMDLLVAGCAKFGLITSAGKR
ncbi:hypothetical protein SprV_0501994100 [Sparganum proliferum]